MPKYRNFEERWEWLLAFMSLDDPFVAEILSIMTIERDDSIGTMGVLADGADIRMKYSRPFVEKLSDEAVRYVLCHEINHLVLHHCTTRKTAQGESQRRHNVAADLEVNSLIVETPFRHRPQAPYEGLHAVNFGLPPMLSLEQYLARLPQNLQDNNKSKKGSKGSEGEGGGDPQDGDGDPQEGEGESKGSKDGDPQDGSFDNHDGWSEDNMVADEIIRQKIREMENSDRYWGKMTGDVKQRILEAQKSRIAWHKLLRYKYGQLVSKGFVHTFKRPNRRFGYPYTGFKRDGVDRVILLWDLSGSIQDVEKSRFLAETNRIAEQQPVDVLMFDYGLIGKVVPFNRKMKFINTVGGGGGTSFLEPFEYADNMRYGTVICLTDGCAASIPAPKHIKHILWAIVGDGKPPVTWGHVINIDTINGRLVQPLHKAA